MWPFTARATQKVVAHPKPSRSYHTFLDNAAKYSPKRERVEIYVKILRVG